MPSKTFISEDESDTLIIDTTAPGGGDCYLNGNHIPSSKLWGTIFKYNAVGEPTPPELLFELAHEATMYRTEKQMVFRIFMADGEAFAQAAEELVRPRPIMGAFNLRMGVISKGVPDQQAAFLALVSLANDHNYVPVARVDQLVFFVEGTEKKREHLYWNVGSADWLRLGVLAKRPGATRHRFGVPIFEFEEHERDGVIMISDAIERPMQGTGIITRTDGRRHLVKGVIHPPFEGQNNSIVSVDAFKNRIENPLHMDFWPVRELGPARCRINQQTLYFSLQRPAEFIAVSNNTFEGKTFKDYLSRDDRKKVECGVSGALLQSKMSLIDQLTRFPVHGIRASVFPDSSVKVGHFKLLPGSYMDMKHQVSKFDPFQGSLLGKRRGHTIYANGTRSPKVLEAHELEQLDLRYLMHRDPAMPDGSSMVPIKFSGSTEMGKARFGIVINPQDPAWKAAGGDFDGDEANIYLQGDWMHPRTSVTWENLRVDGTARGEDVDSEMYNSLADDVVGLLGPDIALCTRLVERGAMTDELRRAGAQVAQASVDAKKFEVDVEAVKAAAKLIFAAASTATQGVPFLSTLINALKRCKDDRARAAALLKIVQWDRNDPTALEAAMIRRVETLYRIAEDMRFLRALEHPELPENMRKRAYSRSNPTSIERIQALVDNYRRCRDELNAVMDDGFKDAAMAAKDKLTRAMRVLTFTIERGSEEDQMAAIAIAPARIAAQHAPPSAFETIKEDMKEAFIHLVGAHFKDGVYFTEDLKPIPNCRDEFELITHDSPKVNLRVEHVSPSKRSTRVLLTSNATGEPCTNPTKVII